MKLPNYGFSESPRSKHPAPRIIIHAVYIDAYNAAVNSETLDRRQCSRYGGVYILTKTISHFSTSHKLHFLR